MNVGRTSSTHYLPVNDLQKTEASTAASSAPLPEDCNKFLETHKSDHFASGYLNEHGGPPDAGALAIECFEQLRKPYL